MKILCFGHYSQECHVKAPNIRENHAQVAMNEDNMKTMLMANHAIPDKNDNDCRYRLQ